MPLNNEEIAAIAHLARLKIEPEQAQETAQQLSSILEFVNQMEKVDTTGIVPVAHPLDLIARTREDKITETDQRDHFQKIAPAVEGGLYLVPKVID